MAQERQVASQDFSFSIQFNKTVASLREVGQAYISTDSQVKILSLNPIFYRERFPKIKPPVVAVRILETRRGRGAHTIEADGTVLLGPKGAYRLICDPLGRDDGRILSTPGRRDIDLTKPSQKKLRLQVEDNSLNHNGASVIFSVLDGSLLTKP